MKSLEEFVKELNASKELQKEFAEIKDKAALEAFLKAHGCDATADEFAKFVASATEGEISDDAAGDVAGGCTYLLPLLKDISVRDPLAPFIEFSETPLPGLDLTNL